MTALHVLALAANVGILSTYYLAGSGRSIRPFHWANAIGSLPLLAVEVATGAWSVVPLTFAFGAIGAGSLCRQARPVPNGRSS